MDSAAADVALAEYASATAQAAMSAAKSEVNTILLLRQLDQALDQRITEVQRQAPRKPACAPGCNACCHRVVSASIPEVALAARFIAETFSPERLKALAERLAAYADELEQSHGGRAGFSATNLPTPRRWPLLHLRGEAILMSRREL